MKEHILNKRFITYCALNDISVPTRSLLYYTGYIVHNFILTKVELRIVHMLNHTTKANQLMITQLMIWNNINERYL